MDSDNDGTINAADAAVEDEGSGVIIPVNDDDQDGTPDMDQPGTVAGEDDLAELKLSLFPPDFGTTTHPVAFANRWDEHLDRSGASWSERGEIFCACGAVSLAVAKAIR